MEKFATYLRANRFTQAEAARAIGCSDSALSLWLKGARKIESIAVAVAIEKWTNGAVKVEDLA